MTIRWFSDEDRERMRAEKAERAEQGRRELLFFEFLAERGDCGKDGLVRPEQIDQLVALGTLTAHAARFLEAAVAAGLDVLVFDDYGGLSPA